MTMAVNTNHDSLRQRSAGHYHTHAQLGLVVAQGQHQKTSLKTAAAYQHVERRSLWNGGKRCHSTQSQRQPQRRLIWDARSGRSGARWTCSGVALFWGGLVLGWTGSGVEGIAARSVGARRTGQALQSARNASPIQCGLSPAAAGTSRP